MKRSIPFPWKTCAKTRVPEERKNPSPWWNHGEIVSYGSSIVDATELFIYFCTDSGGVARSDGVVLAVNPLRIPVWNIDRGDFHSYRIYLLHRFFFVNFARFAKIEISLKHWSRLFLSVFRMYGTSQAPFRTSLRTVLNLLMSLL